MAMILLAAHLLLSLLVFLGIRLGWLRVHSYMFFVAALLPFWGVALVLVLHFQIALKADNTLTVGVEKLKLESELYRPISMDASQTAQSTVPMEEALLINSSAQRRALILDVLHDNPKEYISFLQKAGNNDDTEVVHYAVTAMVEISKENDDMLHALESQYRQDPKNPQTLADYTDFLWECLSQNLMQGQVEQMNRQIYSDLMEQKLAGGGTTEDYSRVVSNAMKQANYARAGELLDRMAREHPGEESYYLLKLQYLAAQGRGQEIGALLAEIREKQIFLSAAGKEAIAFWDA